METLVLVALITWGLARYAGTELIATARGTEPPRLRDRQRRAERAHERRMARESRRTGPSVGDALAQRIADRIAHPRGPRSPGPARAAMGEWWSDAWGYATERRRERHQRHADGDLLRQRLARNLRQRFGDTTDPHWRPRPTTAQRPPHRTDNADPVVIDAEPTPAPPTDHTKPAPVEETPTDGPPEDPEKPNQHEPDHTQQPEAIHTEPDTEPEPRSAAEHQSTATIHPIRKDIPMTGANPNLTSGETLDPGSANHFCEQMQNVGQRLLTELDQSVASLTQAGVSGEPIRLLEQMRENAQLFTSSAGEAKTHFGRHLNTQDQVLSDDTLAGTVNGTYIGTRS